MTEIFIPKRNYDEVRKYLEDNSQNMRLLPSVTTFFSDREGRQTFALLSKLDPYKRTLKLSDDVNPAIISGLKKILGADNL